jgi:DNA ligase (NAD+)
MNIDTGNFVIYQDNDGKEIVDVKLVKDTMWLSLSQISQLFQRDKSVISRHLRNIFIEEELDKLSTVAFFATVQNEGGHSVERKIEYYNLDAIISVGYRVNSKRGTHFRKWASSVLKEHLIKGYSINHKIITKEKIIELQGVIELLSTKLTKGKLVNDLGLEVIEIVQKYAKTWNLLLRYDENRLETLELQDEIIGLSYKEAKLAITTLSANLREKKEANDLFGIERKNALEGILGNIIQSFSDLPVYKSNMQRAANLLSKTIHLQMETKESLVYYF